MRSVFDARVNLRAGKSTPRCISMCGSRCRSGAAAERICKFRWLHQPPFPGLKFYAWDESHSAQIMGANSMKYGDEITVTDTLLVTGKRPYSLAMLMSTSMVFQNKFGDAQLADEVPFVQKLRVGATAVQQSG